MGDAYYFEENDTVKVISAVRGINPYKEWEESVPEGTGGTIIVAGFGSCLVEFLLDGETIILSVNYDNLEPW